MSECSVALPRWNPASALAPATDRALGWTQLARALACLLPSEPANTKKMMMSVLSLDKDLVLWQMVWLKKRNLLFL